MSADFAYVAIKACGCMVAAAVDRPEYQKENAKHVAQWMRRGYVVERVDVERVRKELLRCTHRKPRAR